MKVLTFLAKRFWWKAHSRTLADEPESRVEDQLEDWLEEHHGRRSKRISYSAWAWPARGERRVVPVS